MNGKVKELMIKCYNPYGNFGYEKFANLLIKECIDIAEDTRYDGKVVANRIKFVFGLDTDTK